MSAIDDIVDDIVETMMSFRIYGTREVALTVLKPISEDDIDAILEQVYDNDYNLNVSYNEDNDSFVIAKRTK